MATNPNKLFLHIHGNDDKADAYNKVMQSVFEDAAVHQQIFPDVVPDKDRGWSSKGLYFKWRDKTGKHKLVDKDGWSHLPNKDPQYLSIGWGASVIGRRSDYIILDDPFDPEKMDSPDFRKKFVRSFKMIVKSRLKPGGSIIFVCNRWHHDDPVPYLMEMGFDVVTFPAIRINDAGEEESYCEEMWPLTELKELRHDLQDIDFNCLYQGDPSGVEGALIKRSWFKYFKQDADYIYIPREDGSSETIHKRSLRVFQAVDPATSIKKTADYFAICTAGVDHKGRLFILDVFEGREEGTEHIDLLLQYFQRWRPFAQGVEKVGFQLTLIQNAKKSGLPIMELPRFGDKLDRHTMLATRYRGGMIYHDIQAAWRGKFELQLTQLPKAPHDDMADAAADATEQLSIVAGLLSGKEMREMNKRGRRSFAETRY